MNNMVDCNNKYPSICCWTWHGFLCICAGSQDEKLHHFSAYRVLRCFVAMTMSQLVLQYNQWQACIMLPKRSNNGVILQRCTPHRAQLSQEWYRFHRHQGSCYLHILVHIYGIRQCTRTPGSDLMDLAIAKLLLVPMITRDCCSPFGHVSSKSRSTILSPVSAEASSLVFFTNVLRWLRQWVARILIATSRSSLIWKFAYTCCLAWTMESTFCRQLTKHQWQTSLICSPVGKTGHELCKYVHNNLNVTVGDSVLKSSHLTLPKSAGDVKPIALSSALQLQPHWELHAVAWVFWLWALWCQSCWTCAYCLFSKSLHATVQFIGVPNCLKDCLHVCKTLAIVLTHQFLNLS